MVDSNEKIYRISFRINTFNWVSLSSISKDELMDFIKYLYSLKRSINVFPYIPGGLAAGCIPNPYMDKTYLVERIAKDIKNKTDIDKMLNTITRDFISEKSCYGIHFIEDVYEFYLSLGIAEKVALQAVKNHYTKTEIERYLLPLTNKRKLQNFANWIGDDHSVFPYHSRWVYVYMFRNEFKKYMHDKGYKITVDGGWVINDKEREMKLGLIDENGELY